MLTEIKVRQAKRRPKPYKLQDHGGLYLYVSTTGVKSWRYDYRLHGKRETLTIGKYPEVSLGEARVRHVEARRNVETGISPAHGKRAAKQATKVAQADSFRAIGEAWYSETAPHRSEIWRQAARRWLTKELYPAVGDKPVREVTPADILAVMRSIEARGTARTAGYVRQVTSRVFQHAIRNLRADFDPAQSLRGAIVQPPVVPRAALTAKELPAFLDAVDAYPGNPGTRLAARLLLLTLVRKSELLGGAWEELDLDRAEWRIPAERTKMRSRHLVPLSVQAVETFREMQTLACGSRYVLPRYGNLHKPMGDRTLNSMFDRMGYRGTLTVHGLRATASTILNEQGWRPDVIERQLAHIERNKVRAAYHRSEYLEERRKMLQHWADYLDSLNHGANVVPLKPGHRRYPSVDCEIGVAPLPGAYVE